MQLTDPQPTGTASFLDLRFASGTDGRTHLVAAQRRGQSHVQRPLYVTARHPALATVMLLNRSAGIFEGDSLRMEITLQAGASAALRAPALTRVHAMSGGEGASAVRLYGARGTYLEWLPMGTLLCGGAALRQRLEADLEPGAMAAIGDTWSFGRTAYGERHAYRSLHAQTEIRIGGTLILAEALHFDEGRDRIDAAAYGSLQLVGPAEVAEPLLPRVRDVLGRHALVSGGASALPRGAGIAVRAMGESAHAVHAALADVVTQFREPALRTASRCARAGGT